MNHIASWRSRNAMVASRLSQLLMLALATRFCQIPGAAADQRVRIPGSLPGLAGKLTEADIVALAAMPPRVRAGELGNGRITTTAENFPVLKTARVETKRLLEILELPPMRVWSAAALDLPRASLPETVGVLFTKSEAFIWALHEFNRPGMLVFYDAAGVRDRCPVPGDMKWKVSAIDVKALERPKGEDVERVANGPNTAMYVMCRYAGPSFCMVDAGQLRKMLSAAGARYYSGREAMLRFANEECVRRSQRSKAGRHSRIALGAALTTKKSVLFFEYIPFDLLLLQTEDGSTGLLVFD